MHGPSRTETQCPSRSRPTARRAKAMLCRFWVVTAVLLLVVAPAAVGDAHAASRIKDVADFEGVRDNLLVGYGLVVGLNGSGDTLSNSAFTKQSLIGMLEPLRPSATHMPLRG